MKVTTEGEKKAEKDILASFLQVLLKNKTKKEAINFMKKFYFWFDLDNSPRVPLFRPIFDELQKRNINYLITAREFAQTKELLDFYGIKHILIGKHAGKSKIKKIINLFIRANQLKKVVAETKIDLAVSHGSRTQLVACKRLNIPSVLMADYEFTESKIFNTLADYLVIPKFIPDERLVSQGFNLKKVIRYNCFKEELYLSNFKPDLDFYKQLNINENDILVVLRPPSMVGNYHDRRSEDLMIAAIKHLSKFEDVIILIVNRTKVEREFIETKLALGDNVRFLNKPVDGLQLLYAADITISGGGTMNRESALLGTRTYSIFTGKRPYLDEYLQELGRLKFISSIEEIETIVPKKERNKVILKHLNNPKKGITELLIDIALKKR